MYALYKCASFNSSYKRRLAVKKLILVRHGHYDYGDGNLTNKGFVQITGLAKKLFDVLNGSSILMLSSTAPRAVQSAEIISKELGVPFESHDVLWSGSSGKVAGTMRDFKQVLEMIIGHEHQADAVILVTHYEYVEDFPRFFGTKVFGHSLKSYVIPVGTSWLIDCEEKTMVRVSDNNA